MSSPHDPASESSATHHAGVGTEGLEHLHRILLETARQLGSSLEPDAIFARLQDSICGAMRCDGIIVSSLDRAENRIRCSYAWVGGNVLDPTTLPPLRYEPDATGMQSQVIRTGRPTMFEDVVERVRDPHGTYYEVDPQGGVRDLSQGPPPKARSAIMVPLRLEGEVVGVVQVMADAAGAYTTSDLELLEGVSLLLAVALENARLYRRAHDELEVRRRAERDLRETEEALREADRRKDEFLATLGHELRNPLSPIRHAVELLRLKGSPDPETRWSHDMIQRQVSHLARLIDDLLDVSRITQGRLELRREPVELVELLRGAVDSVRPAIDQQGHDLAVEVADDPIFVNADPVRLTQVFANLLDNAAKYTPTGGRIGIAVAASEREVRIAVKDSGSGIAPENLPRVFDLFYQADHAPSLAPGGLGIGLTLVKRLVEMHGGGIEAQSGGPSAGSTFIVRLPRLPAAAGLGSAGAARPEAVRSRRILVADDNRDSADSMAVLLRMAGNDVEVAYDGQEALESAERFRPEVLLLDIGMPRLDGYQVAQEVRGRPWGRDLVLIAATGWGQEEDRRRSLEAGFDAHMVKPLDPGELMKLLETGPRP